jgi:hypothetical protein
VPDVAPDQRGFVLLVELLVRLLPLPPYDE